jgi:hypothetical protein
MRRERGRERRHRELTDATTMARWWDAAEAAAGGDFGSLTTSIRKISPPRHLENFRALVLSYIGCAFLQAVVLTIACRNMFLQAGGIDHRM